MLPVRERWCKYIKSQNTQGPFSPVAIITPRSSGPFLLALGGQGEALPEGPREEGERSGSFCANSPHPWCFGSGSKMATPPHTMAVVLTGSGKVFLLLVCPYRPRWSASHCANLCVPQCLWLLFTCPPLCK
jgi:hypothetical protein